MIKIVRVLRNKAILLKYWIFGDPKTENHKWAMGNDIGGAGLGLKT